MFVNVDNNHSSRQANNVFHGTSISVVQFPARDTSIPDPDNCVYNNRDIHPTANIYSGSSFSLYVGSSISIIQ